MARDIHATRSLARLLGAWARACVRHFDTFLRRVEGVSEFSMSSGCILRLAQRQSNCHIKLSDGTEVLKGESIGELHLWNERIPSMNAEGADLRWALTFHRLLVRSFQELAVYVEQAPDFQNVRAFRGEMIFAWERGLAQKKNLAAQIGLDVVPIRWPRWSWGRFAQFWQGLYWYAIIWTFQPASLRGKHLLRLQCDQVWISREELLRRYGI